ncbi:hypothetical protein BDW59DRAFT_165560 [Aspergillus cavernicola]|uniref:Uncharacterized protein n=1 Tax=Aspergillus cavernicola TaxID=176166 RepID=A0ABR4HRV7_9EURO
MVGNEPIEDFNISALPNDRVGAFDSIRPSNSSVPPIMLGFSPLETVLPKNILEMTTPSLSFISIPRSDMRISGPFEETIESLIKLNIPKTSD